MNTAALSPLIDLRGIVYRRPGTPRTTASDIAAASGNTTGTGYVLQVPRFRLAAGERLAIDGPSGSGKSTFLDLLAMLRQPTAIGDFRMAGVDVGALWPLSAMQAPDPTRTAPTTSSRTCVRPSAARAARTRLRGRLIGYVLQTGGLLPYLSVRENLLLPQRLSGRLDLDWLARLLNTLGLQALSRRLPAELSLGERQRVAVARALAHRPAVVLADEPTASLDATNGERVLELLVALCEQSAAGLIVVSHDATLTARHGLTPISCRRSADATVIER